MQIQVFQFLDGCHQTATKVIVSQTASQSQDSSNPSCSYGPMRTLSKQSRNGNRHRELESRFSVPGIESQSSQLVSVFQASYDNCDLFLCPEYNAVVWISEVGRADF